MNSIVLQATINEADYPIFLGLFEKFKVKTVLLKKKVGKKTYPIETAIPNEETHPAGASLQLVPQYYQTLIFIFPN